MYSIGERSFDRGGLAVQRHAHSPAPGVDREFCGAQCVKRFLARCRSQESFHRELQKAPTAGVMQHIQAQAAAVQALASPQVKTLDLVVVVADKNHRRFSVQLLSVTAQTYSQYRVALQRRERRREKSRPLPFAMLPLRVAAIDDLRVNPQTGII